jgi:hypothetical protein
MANTTLKPFQPKSKDVRYLNKDFSQFRESLIEFAKYYYPNTYKDFSDASPGMMFIEMASYVGDVLSFYIDNTYKESLIQNAKERRNIIALGRYLGYKPKPARASIGQIDVFQIVPAVYSNGEYIPNTQYALSIRENMQVSNNVGSSFLTVEPINFATNTSASPLTYSVYQRNTIGSPTFFLLKKTAHIRSGQLVTKTFSISDLSSFLKLELDENNVLEIIEVKDADNNKWYEVDYLAQDTVYYEVPNDEIYEGRLSAYRGTVPYIMKQLKTSRRFVVHVDENNKTFLEFGSGTDGFADEIINFSSQKVGAGLSNLSNMNLALDPSNFLKNDAYGLAPSNTTLTVTYSIGGGYESNSPSNSITNISTVNLDNTTDGLTPEESSLLNTVKTSLRVNNPDATVGGKGPETDEEIRQNAIASFGGQNRVVTKEDYLARVYSMPSKYGAIAKAQIVTYNSLNISEKNILVGMIDSVSVGTVYNDDAVSYFRRIAYDRSNPFAINMYVLSYDENNNLQIPNEALTSNLLTYLQKYRMMTDGINIIDGYVINIGVEFSITTFKGYNKKEVLRNAINAIKDFFNIDRWEFSQPINISQLRLEIAKIEGVQTVVNMKIKNLTPLTTGGQNYSSVEYDIDAATKNDAIYPSLDPAIFEIKYPDKDIKGTVL